MVDSRLMCFSIQQLYSKQAGIRMLLLSLHPEVHQCLLHHALSWAWSKVNRQPSHSDSNPILPAGKVGKE